MSFFCMKKTNFLEFQFFIKILALATNEDNSAIVEAVSKTIQTRLDEYDFSIRMLRDKVDSSVTDIESKLVQQIELKSHDTTQYAIKEMGKIQSELQQAHSLDIKKIQEESSQYMKRIKKDIEDSLMNIYKKSTQTLAEELNVKIYYFS